MNNLLAGNDQQQTNQPNSRLAVDPNLQTGSHTLAARTVERCFAAACV